jgi:multimeric flavodoxin WrbA
VVGDPDGALENTVLGQQLKAFFDTLLSALLSATYTSSVGPVGPMLAPSSTTLSQLQSTLDSLLSTVVFTT